MAVVQIDEYGPWTVTPSPRRETDLQALQARLYADFADFVGQHDGYAFYNRFDNMIGVSNGIGPDGYERFQERVRNRYPVTVSVGIGDGTSPVEAVNRATAQLQAGGSAQDPDRSEVLNATLSGDDRTDLTVAHFDIVDVTGSYTDEESAVDAGLDIQQSVLALQRHLKQEYDSVGQFVGGDNIIAICPNLSLDAFRAIVDHVEAELGITYQVGIGRGATAHDAGMSAKHALEVCREAGSQVEQHAGTPSTDADPDAGRNAEPQSTLRGGE